MKVLAIGDSLTAGYNRNGGSLHPYSLALSDKLAPFGSFSIVNKGKSGEGTTNMAKRLEKILEIYEFDIAIILGGTNDLSALEPKAIFDNLKKMHDQCRAKNIKTFAVTIPELGVEGTVPVISVFRNAVNNLLREYCTKMGIPVIDLAQGIPYQALSLSDRELLWDDKIHFTPAGYDRFASIVFECMKQELGLHERGT
eukprot:Phypoly_transcript_12648.p1 GENE.Phypoly_transcript_12648~~Phypoly_transcript_12648.p1  ORF type:complete len:198 (+),score=23.39 Phypoly_transcript_12648:291-884(+)